MGRHQLWPSILALSIYFLCACVYPASPALETQWYRIRGVDTDAIPSLDPGLQSVASVPFMVWLERMLAWCLSLLDVRSEGAASDTVPYPTMPQMLIMRLVSVMGVVYLGVGAQSLLRVR
ncbi:hypothetical protein KIPB_014430 [Kipferlia bialata]|uniref:Uncharacterized protein n=1 Tax=Kipferlia bialata TaxID=797122 RepID=A0A9K3GQT6_9EUKA|nr:hypothetical protein KIPB_014430 [Kipferlia bialata]|eukprot:g14430.t1